MMHKVEKGNQLAQRRFSELCDLYGDGNVVLASKDSLAGARLKADDYVAVMNAINGRLYIPRGSFEAEVDGDFYFITDDSRKKELRYSTEKSPLLFIKLENDFHDMKATITAQSIRLFRKSVNQLEIGQEYYLTGENPEIKGRGIFLGVNESKNGKEMTACFTTAVLCLKRSKNINATPVNELSNISIGNYYFHQQLVQHGILFNESTDSYIENGIVLAGIKIENLVGKKVRVVRLGDLSGPKNNIQFNCVRLRGIHRIRNELYYDKTPATTWLKDEVVALIEYQNGRFQAKDGVKRALYSKSPDYNRATMLMKNSGIYFDENQDTYLINGERIEGVAVSKHTNEWVQIVSFGEDEVFIERNNVHFTCLNYNKDIICENYYRLIPTKGRAIALIANKRRF